MLFNNLWKLTPWINFEVTNVGAFPDLDLNLKSHIMKTLYDHL